jgi:uncharacterized damage-inducible protein DinB
MLEHLSALAATADELVGVVTSATAEQLSRAPAPGEWPASAVLAHLVHTEVVYGVRVGMIVTEDRPAIAAYDQGAWADRFGAVDGDPARSLPLWQALRARNLAVLAGLRDADWRRAGDHAERGTESVADIVEHLVTHDREHVAQLRAALATAGS